MKTFYAILANSLAASLTNNSVWFAVTFWVYLETKSVLATSVMAGVYLATVAISGFFLGSLVEATEQTILQKVIPPERQGRVFGFAQSIEQAASPLTAFMIGPIAKFVFISFMTTGRGAGLIGSWFGTGTERGLGLLFMVTGVVGLIVTLIAMRSAAYRQLSLVYKKPETTYDAETS
jgi:hypothetical protein